MSNTQISLYTDILLIEAVLAEPHLYKKAGFASDLLSRVGEYFESKIDPNDPTGSVLRELAPGAISVLFSSLGMGRLGLLLGFLASTLHIDVPGILSSLYEKVREMISDGEKTSSSQIDQAVASTVQEHNTATFADDGKIASSLELLHDAKMISLVLIAYEKNNLRLTKEAVPLLGGYNRRTQGASILGRILGLVIKVALASAGLMVAGDIANKFLGRPNSIDKNHNPSHPSAGETPASSISTSTQTKYHFKSDAPIPKSLPIVNNPTNIDNILIQFAKDVYSGLDGKESLIRNTPGFQAIKEKLSYINSYNPGSATTMMIPGLNSKKQLVDYFIDDVANSDQSGSA